jgi:tRNA threonylcarbamoyladenosine biosynthesis protein TsaB
LEALARQALGRGGAPAPRFVAASCDAQRGQLYAALYLREGRSLQRFEDERVVGPAELIRWAAELAGASGVAWGSLDPGPLSAEPAWEERARLGEIVEQVSPVLAPAIGKIALQLTAQGKLTDGLSLDANYIRRPDAEVKWKGYARPVVVAPAKVTAPSVRPFQTADADAVAQLAASSPQAAQWPESSYAQLLASGYKAWVSVTPAGERPEPGAITGFLISRAIPPDAEILNLAVAPPDRRRGVGGALLRAALSEFGSAEVRRVFLEVRVSNAAAISFYKKHLFRGTGARPGYYQNPVEDAIQMERML